MQLTPLEIKIYPCKGLPSISPLRTLWLPQRGIVGDRQWAFQFKDNEAPQGECEDFDVTWMSKKYLLNQHDFPAMAALTWQELSFETEVASAEEFLKQMTSEKKQELETFFYNKILQWNAIPTARHPKKSQLRIVGKLSECNQLQNEPKNDLGESFFRDSQAHEISFINTSSLMDFENKMGCKIEKERFRGNVLVNLGEPWIEMKFTSETSFSIKHSSINEGQNVNLKFSKLIDRCLNIDVCPKKGKPNLELLKFMNKTFKHPFLGFSAGVIEYL